jgi:hypothetical protein
MSKTRKRYGGFARNQTLSVAIMNDLIWSTADTVQLGMLMAAIAGSVPKTRHSGTDPEVVVRNECRQCRKLRPFRSLVCRWCE